MVTVPAVALPEVKVIVSTKFVVEVDASALVKAAVPVEPVLNTLAAGLLRPVVVAVTDAFVNVSLN